MKNNLNASDFGTTIQEVNPQTSERRIHEDSFTYAGQPQHVITGWKEKIIEDLVEADRAKLIFTLAKNPMDGLRTMNALVALKRSVIGAQRIAKKVNVDGRYFWDLYVPGWPGQTFREYFKGEMNRISPLQGKANRFTNVFLAITKKCPLHCEHCFEWEALNKADTLSLEDLRRIVHRFYQMGISQIQLTGGEPMLRLDDMIEVISTAPGKIDFWVLTSGVNFNATNAHRLKEAGLTGVVVSMDHFDPEAHNRFRGNQHSFALVQEAVKHAIEANLVTALSICVTRSFVTEANLMAYAELAKKMGVAFIQVLEPKPVGHYAGKDVVLHEEQTRILDEFYQKMNFDEAYAGYPIVCYHGYYQRKVGCFGSGSRSVYVDTDGEVMPCPFCRRKAVHSLAPEMKEVVDQMQKTGCHTFRHATFYKRAP